METKAILAQSVQILVLVSKDAEICPRFSRNWGEEASAAKCHIFTHLYSVAPNCKSGGWPKNVQNPRAGQLGVFISQKWSFWVKKLSVICLVRFSLQRCRIWFGPQRRD